jgi:two-component system chemotaxis response regulator CheY
VALANTLRVLVVDDSQAIRLNMKSFLRQLGFDDIDLAESAILALDKLRANGRDYYDLVISDWAMDRMTGYELLKAVREDNNFRDLPFIMITANNSPENVIKAKQAGVNNYIIKPFTVATLKQRIEAVLGALT